MIGSDLERFTLCICADSKTGCWNWTGPRLRSGYGSTSYKSAERRAHRLSWRLFNGTIPEGMSVCHKCDNPRCVRPEHLFLGTQLDNVRDMIAKGRDRKALGQKNGRAKMDEGSVREIRRLHSDGLSHRRIAGELGLNRGAVWAVLGGRTWTWVR